MKTKTYKVNEIFLSVQAEGANAGRPAVFVRFAGCNLSCPFCDTNHEPYTEMTGGEIDREIDRLANGDTRTLVVFTGGEPCLQLESGERLANGYTTAMETNGTLEVPRWIDWITVSPKSMLPTDSLIYLQAKEVKFLCGLLPEWYMVKVAASHPCLKAYVQPLERDGRMNVADAIAFAQAHPDFSVSVQWHKLLGVK